MRPETRVAFSRVSGCKKTKVDKFFLLNTSFFPLTALTIRCYECAPNFNNVSRANMCNNPTDTINCTDPSYDSCLSISLSGLRSNASDFAKFSLHSLDCTTKLLCDDKVKNLTCDLLKNEANVPEFKVEKCKMSCCQGDLCNKPLGGPSASSSPRLTPPSPSASIHMEISVGSTTFPLNCALLVILRVIPVVVMNII